MSQQYDRYLKQHKENVEKGFYWISENLPGLLCKDDNFFDIKMCLSHDASKTSLDEYRAYDAYFYGGNKSFKVVEDFRRAWLLHIHRNPHHWQYWVLINDEPSEGEIVLDMPYTYIIEMICDWWAFSWSKGELLEIFKWYDSHKDHMKLSDKTRSTVEWILGSIKNKLYDMHE